MKYPETQENIKFLDEWHAYEGGAAAYNPLNTTLRMPGATNYNSAGVQQYVSAAQGAEATVLTLENGYYPHVLAALKSGSPYTYQDRAGLVANIKTWGTTSFANALRGGA